MSIQTLNALEEAIRAHLADVAPDAMLTDWFVGYGFMVSDDRADDGMRHGRDYSCSRNPHGALGVAQLTMGRLHSDLDELDEEDDD